MNNTWKSGGKLIITGWKMSVFSPRFFSKTAMWKTQQVNKLFNHKFSTIFVA